MTAPTTTTRTVLAVAAMVLGVLLLLCLTPVAAAQDDVDCDEVPYNQRIVIVCDTVDNGSVGGAGIPTTTPNASPDDDDGDTGTDDGDTDTADPDDSADAVGDRIDRGTRGERVLADDDLFDVDADDSSVADDTADDSSVADDTADERDTIDGRDAADEGDDEGQAGPGDESARAESDASDRVTEGSASDETTGVFVGVVDPAPSDLPLVIGVAGLLGVGTVFLLATRRADQASGGR